jgi:hypothetical protein
MSVMSTDPFVTIRHILSPIPSPTGRSPLCGATDGSDYNGLDEAYRAHVEGWTSNTITCRDCVLTALVAMGIDR